MTVGSALSEGLLVTVLGLSIVFAVLIILMGVLMLMKVFFYKEPETKAAVVTETAVSVLEAAVQDTQMDDEELIAVLTAAVAASLNTSTYNLQIKSYRRTDTNNSAWNRAGIRDTIESRI